MDTQQQQQPRERAPTSQNVRGRRPDLKKELKSRSLLFFINTFSHPPASRSHSFQPGLRSRLSFSLFLLRETRRRTSSSLASSRSEPPVQEHSTLSSLPLILRVTLSLSIYTLTHPHLSPCSWSNPSTSRFASHPSLFSPAPSFLPSPGGALPHTLSLCIFSAGARCGRRNKIQRSRQTPSRLLPLRRRSQAEQRQQVQGLNRGRQRRKGAPKRGRGSIKKIHSSSARTSNT